VFSETEGGGSELDAIAIPDVEPDGDLDNVLSANINALFESDGDEADIPEPETAPENDFSDEELDTMFDGEEEPGAIASMVEQGSGEGTDDIVDLDDIPDPDPLPDSLTSDMSDMDDDMDVRPRKRRKKTISKPKKKSKAGLYFFIFLLIFLLATAGGLYFMRAMVVQYVPALSPYFDMVGAHTTQLGDGLKIEEVSSQRVSSGGVDFLIITGNIVNSVDHDVETPLLKAVLSNAEGLEIQSVVQEAPEPTILSHDSIGFKIEIEEPTPLARSLNVIFAPTPKVRIAVVIMVKIAAKAAPSRINALVHQNCLSNRSI